MPLRAVHATGASDADSDAGDATVDSLKIKLVSNTGKEVLFSVKKTTKLGKVMRAYCSRLGIPVESVRFLVDGNRINEDMLVEQSGLENNDVVDVVVTMEGGGGGLAENGDENTMKRTKRRRDEDADEETAHLAMIEHLGWAGRSQREQDGGLCFRAAATVELLTDLRAAAKLRKALRGEYDHGYVANFDEELELAREIRARAQFAQSEHHEFSRFQDKLDHADKLHDATMAAANRLAPRTSKPKEPATPVPLPTVAAPQPSRPPSPTFAVPSYMEGR